MARPERRSAYRRTAAAHTFPVAARLYDLHGRRKTSALLRFLGSTAQYAFAHRGLETRGLRARRIRGRSPVPADLRRLELARSLACRPKLLIADEAMAGLSHAEVDEILALLLAVNAEGVAVVMIEHIMRAVTAFAERLVVFVADKIADSLEVLAIERSRGGLSWRMTPFPSTAWWPVMARSSARRRVDGRRAGPNGCAARRQRQRQNNADAMRARPREALG